MSGVRTVFVQSPSSSIQKIDIPTDLHGHLRFERAVEAGELTILDDDLVAESLSAQGGIIFVLASSLVDDEPEPERKLTAAEKRAAAKAEKEAEAAGNVPDPGSDEAPADDDSND